jgi:hypothetical protein
MGTARDRRDGPEFEKEKLMALSIVGLDGNPFSTRDVNGINANYIYANMLVVPSGNYTTGGDTLNLSTVAGIIPSGSVPLLLFVAPMGTGAVPSLAAAGGLYQVVQAAVPTLANYLLKIFALSAGALSEYSAGAYGTDVLGDVIVLTTIWRKLI